MGGCLAVCPDSRRSRPAHVHTSHQQTSPKTMLGIWPVGRQKPNMRCDAMREIINKRSRLQHPASHHPLIRLFLSSALIAADDLPRCSVFVPAMASWLFGNGNSPGQASSQHIHLNHHPSKCNDPHLPPFYSAL